MFNILLYYCTDANNINESLCYRKYTLKKNIKC